MRDMKQKIWLGLGIGAMAAVLGYMVGASSTPIAGVALPAIFGLVITAFGLVSNLGLEKKLENVSESIGKDKAPDVQKKLDNIQNELRQIPGLMGKLLVVFTLLYMTGLVIGARARTNEWFAPSLPHKEIELPWAKNNELPPTSSDAIEWIALQQQLLQLGYTQAQIEHLYSIQINEWKETGSAYPTGISEILQNVIDGSKSQKKRDTEAIRP